MSRLINGLLDFVRSDPDSMQRPGQSIWDSGRGRAPLLRFVRTRLSQSRIASQLYNSDSRIV